MKSRSAAFTALAPSPLRLRGATPHAASRRCAARARRQRPAAQLPPPYHQSIEPPLPDDMAPPERYKWNPDFPGTVKPGTCPENFPLEEVLTSGVYERMKYVEEDIDACTPIVHEVDEDFLEWLNKVGRLLPRDAELTDDLVAEAIAGGEVDEDAEEDGDKSMLQYYARQRDPGDGSDFGGVSESFIQPSGL